MMLSGLKVRVDVGENDGCLTIFCSYWERSVRVGTGPRKRRFVFELLNGKHDGGG